MGIVLLWDTKLTGIARRGVLKKLEVCDFDVVRMSMR